MPGTAIFVATLGIGANTGKGDKIVTITAVKAPSGGHFMN
jgi:hypothetical protein